MAVNLSNEEVSSSVDQVLHISDPQNLASLQQVYQGLGVPVGLLISTSSISSSDFSINNFGSVSASLSNLSSSTGLWTASADFIRRQSNVEITGTLDVSNTSSFAEINWDSSDESLTSFSASTSTRLTTNESDISDLQTDSASFSTRVSNNESTASTHETDITNLEGTASRNESTASTHETRIDNIDSSGSTGLGFWTGSSGTITRESDVEISGSLQISSSNQNLFSVNDSVLFVSKSSNVGINQNSPSSILHVGDDSAGNENNVIRLEGGKTSGFSQIHFADRDSSNVGRIQYNHANNDLIFYVNNIASLKIDNNPNFIFGNGILSTTPQARVDIRGDMRVENSLGLNASFIDTGASGPGAGGSFILYSNDGAAMASGDRLGIFSFGGAEDSSDNLDNSSAITAFATENWNSSNKGSDLRFETTLNGQGSRTERLRITNDGEMGLNQVKPSASLHISSSNTTASFRVDNGANTFFVSASGLVSASSFQADALGTSSFGHVEKQTGTFRIQHPNNPEKEIVHSFVESPTAGDNIYRYTIEAKTDNAIVAVDLPDYFEDINENVQVFVTAQEMFAHGFGKTRGNRLIVNCERLGLYNVMIVGTRKDKRAVEAWKGDVRNKQSDEDYLRDFVDGK